MAFNFSFLSTILNAIPYVISGIQQIHGSAKSGADKKTLAMEALGLAGNTASGVLTGDNAAYAAVATQLAGNLIDQFTAAFKTTNSFGFKPSIPLPSSIPSPTMVVNIPSAATTGAEVVGK